MASTLLLGATGKTGSHILSSLLALPSSQISSVTTISRRAPKIQDRQDTESAPKFTPIVSTDNESWAKSIASMTPSASIIISALATTRAAAGGFENQYKLDHDLNIELAKAARQAGTDTYVLISVGGSDPNSMFGYIKMKGEIEQNILALDFKHTVIVRPGLIAGRREESRPAEAVLRWIADGMGMVSGGLLKDFWAQDADVIARAAVRAGLKAQAGELPGKVTYLGAKEIMAMGRAPM